MRLCADMAHAECRETERPARRATGHAASIAAARLLVKSQMSDGRQLRRIGPAELYTGTGGRSSAKRNYEIVQARRMRMIETGHIVSDPDVLGGEAHIAGHRIAVSDVAIWATVQGMSPQQIADAFNLTLGEVHAALAYYYDHQLEIDRSITESDRRAQDLAAKYPQGWSAETVAPQTPEDS